MIEVTYTKIAEYHPLARAVSQLPKSMLMTDDPERT
jgi:hypothetical protein